MTVRIGWLDLPDSSTREQREKVRIAVERCTFPFHLRLPHRLTVEFRTLERMPLLPGSKTNHSTGFAEGTSIVIWNGADQYVSTYVILHESFHHVRFMASAKLTMMRLLRPRLDRLPADASTPENRKQIHLTWGARLSSYFRRVYECEMDDLVWAFTRPAMQGPYDRLYLLDTAVDKRDELRKAALWMPPVEPDEPTEPPPGEIPPETPCQTYIDTIATLNGTIDGLTQALDERDARLAQIVLIAAGAPSSDPEPPTDPSTPTDGGSSAAPS